MKGRLLSHEAWEVLNARRNPDMFRSEAGKCLLAKHEDPLTIQYSSRGWAQWHTSTVPALEEGEAGRDRQIPGTHQAVNPAKFSETQSQKQLESNRGRHKTSVSGLHTHT